MIAGEVGLPVSEGGLSSDVDAFTVGDSKCVLNLHFAMHASAPRHLPHICYPHQLLVADMQHHTWCRITQVMQQPASVVMPPTCVDAHCLEQA
jgi:hypothetical protein